MSYVIKRVPKPKDQAPDQVVSSYQRFADWVRLNTNALVYSAGAAAFVLLLALGILWVRENRERAASEALAEAVLTMNASGLPTSLNAPSQEDAATSTPDASAAGFAAGPELESALDNFRQVADEHGGGPAGLSARLYEANILFRLGRYQEAASALEALASRSPAFAIEAGTDHLLARSYEALKDYPKAVGTYSQVLDRSNGDARAPVMIDLARCLELSGDVDRAAALLRDVVKDHPGSASAAKADRKLAFLGQSAEKTP